MKAVSGVFVDTRNKQRFDLKNKKSFIKDHLLTQENMWALILSVIIIALLIATSDKAPLWIYQGF
jgi:hypothetical protein